MLTRLRSRLSYANVVATLALFVALGGTSAWATHERILGSDIVDNEVSSADVRNDNLGFGGLVHQDLVPGSVRSSEVANGSLNDEDIGQGTFVNFAGNIGTVPAHGCVDRAVTGINAEGDHLLLTPDANDSSPEVVYDILYRTVKEFAVIHACNTNGTAVNDGTTHFNLLVIDAR